MSCTGSREVLIFVFFLQPLQKSQGIFEVDFKFALAAQSKNGASDGPASVL
jgi:hypothetical protein